MYSHFFLEFDFTLLTESTANYKKFDGFVEEAEISDTIQNVEMEFI